MISVASLIPRAWSQEEDNFKFPSLGRKLKLDFFFLLISFPGRPPQIQVGNSNSNQPEALPVRADKWDGGRNKPGFGFAGLRRRLNKSGLILLLGYTMTVITTGLI